MLFSNVPFELRDSIETFDLFMTASSPGEYGPCNQSLITWVIFIRSWNGHKKVKCLVIRRFGTIRRNKFSGEVYGFRLLVIYLFWYRANNLKRLIYMTLMGSFNGPLELTNCILRVLSALWVRGSACIIFCLKGLVLLPGVFLIFWQLTKIWATLKIWVLLIVIVVFTSKRIYIYIEK